MPKVLITGAAGFLGSHVGAHLSSLGWEILGLSHRENPKINCFEIIRIEMCNPKLVSLVSSFDPDFIFHAAGRATPAKSLEDPAGDYLANVQLTHQLLEAVRSSGRRPKLLFCSSAAVYGQPKKFPINEKFQVKPLSPYGFHKHAAEWLIIEYNALASIPYTILRIFSIYGEGLRRQVVFDLIDRAYKTGSLKIRGTGYETRDFLHINDFCRCVELVMKCNKLNRVLNIASGIETELRQVAKSIATICEIQGEPIFDQVRQEGVPNRWLADISKLNEVGFAPSYSMEQGILETVQWYKLNELGRISKGD